MEISQILHPFFALFLALILAAGCLQVFGCSSDYIPVCGSDGNTYGNSCLAGQAGVQVASYGECAQNVSSECSETDSGKDILAKGITALVSGSQFEDSCVDDSTVMEFYCKGDIAEYESISCPAGYVCTGGLCIRHSDEATYGCTDSEPSPSVYSSGTVKTTNASGVSTFQDVCLDVNTVRKYSCSGSSLVAESMSCPGGFTCLDGACHSMGACYDSDGGGGGQRYVSGTVFSDYGSYSDYCSSGNLLVEYSCVSDSRVSENLNCIGAYVCRGGACVVASGCYDGDDGIDYYEQGTVDSADDSETDYCIDSNTVREYYCGSANEISSVTHDCPSDYSCTHGRCVRDGDIRCTDSDGGRVYGVSGTTSNSDGDLGMDTCLGADLLREYYCNGGDVEDEDYLCPAGSECSSGRCVADESVCSDTDSGLDYGTVGTLTIEGELGSTEDYCEDGDTLREYYCDGAERDYESHVCESGICRDGRCVVMTCQDTDGQDIHVQGYHGYYYDGAGMLLEEACTDSDTVREYYCSGNVLMNELEDCNSGEVCSDGACVEPDVCTDSDGTSITTRGTVTFGTDSETDYCTDFGQVVEWVCDADPEDGFHALSAQSCPAGKYCSNGKCVNTYCSDSDGGEDRYEFGTAKDYLGTVESDECYGADGRRVLEYFCNADNEVDFVYLDCLSGHYCDSGECIAYECTDTDGGIDAFTGGRTTSTDGTSSRDDCWAGGVYEFYCAADHTVDDQWIACPSNYECRYHADGSACEPTCYEDADGDVHFGDEFHPDTCSGDNPIDYYCVDDYSYSYHFMSCLPTNMCVDGHCVPRPVLPP